MQNFFLTNADALAWAENEVEIEVGVEVESKLTPGDGVELRQWCEQGDGVELRRWCERGGDGTALARGVGVDLRGALRQ